ncbi:MAG: putative glycolipid-binding domain-containing protein [Deinococcota bacterium]
MQQYTICWHNLHKPGHETAKVTLETASSGLHLQGTAVFVDDNMPCRLDYTVQCLPTGETESARVQGWLGNRDVDVQIHVQAGDWYVNGEVQPHLTGCVDIDFHFSPLTNILPIRRLQLSDGQGSKGQGAKRQGAKRQGAKRQGAKRQSAEVRAAWLKLPMLNLEPLTQRYTRKHPHQYQYESIDSGFVTDIDVNDIGLVTRYPDLWQAVASTCDEGELQH